MATAGTRPPKLPFAFEVQNEQLWLTARISPILQQPGCAKPGRYLSERLPPLAQPRCVFLSSSAGRSWGAGRETPALQSAPLPAQLCHGYWGFSLNQPLETFQANKNKHSTQPLLFLNDKKTHHTSHQNPSRFSNAICHRVLPAVRAHGWGGRKKPSLKRWVPAGSRGNLSSCLCCQRNYRKLYPETVTDTGHVGAMSVVSFSQGSPHFATVSPLLVAVNGGCGNKLPASVRCPEVTAPENTSPLLGVFTSILSVWPKLVAWTARLLAPRPASEPVSVGTERRRYVRAPALRGLRQWCHSRCGSYHRPPCRQRGTRSSVAEPQSLKWSCWKTQDVFFLLRVGGERGSLFIIKNRLPLDSRL